MRIREVPLYSQVAFGRFNRGMSAQIQVRQPTFPRFKGLSGLIAVEVRNS
jgi:hypothetical protein